MLDAVLETEKRNTYLRLETCLKSLSSLLGATLVAMWQSVEMCWEGVVGGVIHSCTCKVRQSDWIKKVEQFWSIPRKEINKVTWWVWTLNWLYRNNFVYICLESNRPQAQEVTATWSHINMIMWLICRWNPSY